MHFSLIRTPPPFDGTKKGESLRTRVFEVVSRETQKHFIEYDVCDILLVCARVTIQRRVVYLK